MTWIAANLWELIRPRTARDAPARPESAQDLRDGGRAPVIVDAPPPAAPGGSGRMKPDGSAAKPTMRERYDALVIDMKREHGIRVRKWRTSSSGVAWEVHYRDGRITRLIESPYPRGPMSCAIFLHEIGHHAIGLGTYRVRCLEEYHAWKWSLDTMRARNFNVTAAVENRMYDSLHYAVHKAKRRGLRHLPVELLPYLHPRTSGVIDINILPKRHSESSL